MKPKRAKSEKEVRRALDAAIERRGIKWAQGHSIEASRANARIARRLGIHRKSLLGLGEIGEDPE